VTKSYRYNTLLRTGKKAPASDDAIVIAAVTVGADGDQELIAPGISQARRDQFVFKHAGQAIGVFREPLIRQLIGVIFLTAKS
jgi:hypothetical protein